MLEIKYHSGQLKEILKEKKLIFNDNNFLNEIEYLKRIVFTDFKLKSAYYHANRFKKIKKEEELLFELNSFVIELRGSWDQLRFEIAVFYNFFSQWSPEFNRKKFFYKLNQCDENLYNLLKKTRKEDWFKKLDELRNYIVHQGALLGHIQIYFNGEGIHIYNREELIIDGDYLNDTDFREYKHLDIEYINKISDLYYKNMLKIVDNVREHYIRKLK